MYGCRWTAADVSETPRIRSYNSWTDNKDRQQGGQPWIAVPRPAAWRPEPWRARRAAAPAGPERRAVPPAPPPGATPSTARYRSRPVQAQKAEKMKPSGRANIG